MEILKVNSKTSETVHNMVHHDHNFEYDLKEVLIEYDKWNSDYKFPNKESLQSDFEEFIREVYDDKLLDHITGDLDEYEVTVENWNEIFPYLEQHLEKNEEEEYCPHCHQKII